MFYGRNRKKVKLTRRERTLIRNALNCQAIALENQSQKGWGSGDGLLAAWDMQNLAKRIPW